jgi:tRNA U34 5-carboxymethylaminomethyl modifying enzyme MnmG/GidA
VIGPQITAVGKTVVESYGSSISSYETRNQNGKPVINITGTNLSGQISIGDHNQQTQTNNGVASSDLTELMQAVLDAAKGTDVENPVNKLITQLQLEVDEEQPDPPTVEKTLDRLKAVGTTTVAVLPAIDRLIEFVHDKLQAIGMG